jgi:hypothetical protein
MKLFRKSVEENKISLKCDSALPAHVFTFLPIFRLILPIKKNVSNKRCREIKICVLCSETFFFFFLEYRAFYETVSKNMLKEERPQTVCRIRVPCWRNKATCSTRPPSCTHTHTRKHTLKHTHALTHARAHTHMHKQQCKILVASPRQHLFRECAPVSSYAYIAYLVSFYNYW